MTQHSTRVHLPSPAPNAPVQSSINQSATPERPLPATAVDVSWLTIPAPPIPGKTRWSLVP